VYIHVADVRACFVLSRGRCLALIAYLHVADVGTCLFDVTGKKLSTERTPTWQILGPVCVLSRG
jgi:hypothetical protein